MKIVRRQSLNNVTEGLVRGTSQDLEQSIDALRQGLRTLRREMETFVRRADRANKEAIARAKQKRDNFRASQTGYQRSARKRVLVEAEHNLRFAPRESTAQLHHLLNRVDQVAKIVDALSAQWRSSQGRPIPTRKGRRVWDISKEADQVELLARITKQIRVHLRTSVDAGWFAFTFLPRHGHYGAGIYKRTVYLDASEMPQRL